ncbi:glycogen debranching protein GlgX [Tautonia sociabilis]|uniref:Glycogen debranching enzyme GlgX n=1 Tax=Tautonia sociabilis TaxID=2080755 RepID=A0A432MHS3_9BACT|nr:glycogen debranching protein GlgX [Tautonia sociabilis]RUL86865.1 glycogen debranching enzyme GlgX [Tautonia sociabilis]
MPTIRDIHPGEPEPLGPTVRPDGINFAIHSRGATRMELLLFDNIADDSPAVVIPFSREVNKTGDVWHMFVEGLPNGTLYNYRADGPYRPDKDGSRFNPSKALLDPYAPAVSGDFDWNDGDPLGYDASDPDDPDRHLRRSKVANVGGAPRCIAYRSDFDWQGDKHPDIPIEESIIYEVNVRAFTRHHSSETDFEGTYRGFMEKIPHLKDLGITAVELLPVFEFERFDGPFRDPITGERLANAWGYNTMAFFAPESHYSYYGKLGAQVDEFKMMVRELHKAGIEVILDVVFNHSREGNHYGPTVSFRGLDNSIYYMLVPGQPQYYYDVTGCGNTMNCNHPVVRKFILDCLRYWVEEMHVDGFRFDLAAVFAIDVDLVEKGKTPIIEEIETDPVLSRIKLIAEPWSITQYRLGSFSDRRWAEWNGKFRDAVRKFLKGDMGIASELATRVAGSYDLFAPNSDSERSPYHSINFVTCHDGFTLNDLVSYNEKHNERNGEDNRDGHNENESWNCGYEGPVEDADDLTSEQKEEIERLRIKQIKNFLTLLFLSQGTPMLLYGDEMRRTAFGNNNTVYQDNEHNWLNWELLKKHREIYRFTRQIIAFRKKHSIVRRWRYLTAEEDETPILRNITWHGVKPGKPDFSGTSRFLAWTLEAFETDERWDVPIYVASNAFWEPIEVELPDQEGRRWYRVVDTSLEEGSDIVPQEEAAFLPDPMYEVQPRSTIVLIAR